jgi:hypothetical protein
MIKKASNVTAPEKAAPKEAITKPVTSGKKTRGKKDETPYVPSPKLSKAALWLQENGPACEIVDWRAVMK